MKKKKKILENYKKKIHLKIVIYLLLLIIVNIGYMIDDIS